VVGIQPFKQAGEVLTASVPQVVWHHATQDESLAKLETEYQVPDFAGRHPLSILLGGILLCMIRVVPQPSTRQDATQVQTLAKLASRFVKRGTDADPTKLGMRANIRPIQGVPVGIMVGEVSAIRDAGPGVMAQGIRAHVDNQ